MLASLIASLNKIFRKPRVEGRESAKAYSDWEYRMGRGLVAEYLEPKGDLKGKKILDIGCGLGGKTVAYAEGGALEVMGVDLLVGHQGGWDHLALFHTPLFPPGIASL